VQDGSEESDVDDIEMDDDDDVDDDDSSSVSGSSTPPRSKGAMNPERERLREAAFSTSTTALLASALSASADVDVKKGQAVRQQRQTFDRLLDARIKLQRGVTSMNDLSNTVVPDEQVQAAAQQAEDAALALWSTIDSIRCTMLSQDEAAVETGGKRKRPVATRSTSVAELWQQTKTLESAARESRRGVLDKWHSKTQPLNTAVRGSKLTETKSRLTDVLDTYLLTGANPTNNETFDDSVFYQTLLRDLIASRNANNAGVDVAAVAAVKLHPSGSRHKKVDTKASKGRKIRYTVHEKLENFMAPEDRTTWEEAARREFFASLLGNAAALDEGVTNGEASAGEEEDDGQVEALRLFQS
jgi:protein AATF/BFR2